MTTTDGPRGLARGLTNYGDPDFALYLRRSFATSMGYSKAMLARPVRPGRSAGLRSGWM